MADEKEFYGSTDNIFDDQTVGIGSSTHLASHPSLIRRISSPLLIQVERQTSIVEQMGLTETVNEFVPDAVARNIPGLNRPKSQFKVTYFCNICFTKRSIDEGFTLSTCQHQYCPQCITGFITSKINDGVVHLKCFYPLAESSKACGDNITEEDIHALVDTITWDKYERFKANLDSTYARQCPFCDHTQIGDPNDPIMTCLNNDCLKQYCLYHSNAHRADMQCEEYELSIAKETKMNEMAINELGDNVKPCPQCKFRILKNGGCNHMKCVRCGCSFCWLCMLMISDEPVPYHYKDLNSPCKGMQFEGMDREPIDPLVCTILVIGVCICFLPALALGIVFGILWFPLKLLCSTNDNLDDCCNWMCSTLFNAISGCGLLWLAILIAIPACLLYAIWIIIREILVAIYIVIRCFLPCLPPWPSRRNRERNNRERQMHDHDQVERQRLLG